MFIFGDEIDFVPAIIPVDMQTGANDGDWINLSKCEGVIVLVFKGAGTDNDDPTLTFQQASDVAGTGAKNLTVVDTVYQKQGTLTAVGGWTKVTQAAATSYAPGDPSAQSQALYVVQIPTERLDIDGGFCCLRVRIADIGGNAQLGCAIYAPYGLVYGAAPENLPSLIV